MNYSKDSNDKRRKKSKATGKKAKNKIGVIILRVIVIIVIVLGFAGVGAGLGVFSGIIEGSPEIDVSMIRPGSYTSIIYDKDGNEIDRLHGGENRTYVQLSEIPEWLRNGIVAIEDERFYSHNGIDLKGIMRATVTNIVEKDLSQGASTITQQLIKLNVLENSEQKFRRKIQEQYIAVNYESMLTEQFGGDSMKAKEYILEVYLNTIPLGHGNYGVKAAAAYYFNKELSELTLAECACLAGITQNPSGLSPKSQQANNKERQMMVLDKMLELEYITQAEYNQAKDEDIYSNITANFEGVDTQSQYYHSYFVDQVITDLTQDIANQKNISVVEASNIVFNGGLQIYTTIDMNMQRIVDEEFSKDDYYPAGEFEYEVHYSLNLQEPGSEEIQKFYREGYAKNEDEVQSFIASVKAELMTGNLEVENEVILSIPQPQAGMVILDQYTGQVRAIAGGRGDKTQLGQRPFNRATQAARQPGSVFKVMAVYLPGIDSGKLTAATSIVDEPWTYGTYTPKNHWGATFRGPMTVRKAIETSANVVTVRALMEHVGVDTAWNYLQNLGFTTLIDASDSDSGRNDRVPALALGGITDGVTMRELAGAFGAIANEGVLLKPHFYTEVLDHDGGLYIDNTPEPKKVISKQAAFILTDMMKDVVSGSAGTGGYAAFRNVRMPVSGKTGTTTDDKDYTFAGYTPYYTAAIYLGHDIPKRLHNASRNHLIIWRSIMERIHEGLEYKDFVMPEGVVKASICPISGDIPVEGVCSSVTDYFVAGTVPTLTCDSHRTISICSVSGKLATEFCPSESVQHRSLAGRSSMLIENEQTGQTDWSIPIEYCDVHTHFEDDEPILIDPETGLPYGLGLPNPDEDETQTTPFIPPGVNPDDYAIDSLTPFERHELQQQLQQQENPDNPVIDNGMNTGEAGSGVQHAPPAVDDYIYID